jgi:hypothetical protein
MLQVQVSRMTGSRSKGRMGIRYAYYHCNHCATATGISTELVNDAIAEVMNGFRLTTLMPIRCTVSWCKRMLSGNDREREVKAAALRETVRQQEQRMIRLQDSLADGDIAPADFREMHGRYAAA